MAGDSSTGHKDDSYRSALDDLQVLESSSVTCVLVEGPSGCGKTRLLQELASSCGRSQGKGLLYLHLGEQIDGKTLLGTFSSTGSPGEFTWQRGLLTKAVEEGMWVILEDINLAPPDVISLLLPLVKNNDLILHEYSDPIKAASDFRIFLTQRTEDDGTSYCAASGIYQVLRNHCAVYQVPAMSPAQKKQIIRSQFPNLSLLADNLVSTSISLGLHMRNLLKLCVRVSPQAYDGRLSSVQDFMLEVIDCLCGHLPVKEHVALSIELKHLCGGIAKEKVEHLCIHHKPVLQETTSMVSIGRTYLPRISSDKNRAQRLYAHTQSSLALLEKVAVCVANSEPVLLVGETGVGKTATVSYLAQLTGVKLVVMNMSQQTDSTDLLGGFKPIHLSQLLAPIRDKYEQLFLETFSMRENKKFLEKIQLAYINHHWKKLLKMMKGTATSALKKDSKRGLGLSVEWKKLLEKVQKIQADLHKQRLSLAFSFIEGALVEAVRCGNWILLDEINLATPEALQCLSSLLEGPRESFVIPEKPEHMSVERHPQFRLFCCMNPATDIGKKQLSPSIRNRFTEFFVDELQSSSDFQVLIRSYLKKSFPTPALVEGIIKLYRSMREKAEVSLQDGTGRKPHYSLRSLCRALAYADMNPCGTFMRSLFEGFCLTLLSELRSDQHAMVKAHIQECLGVSNQIITANMRNPFLSSQPGSHHKKVGSFWLACSPSADATLTNNKYIITKSVEKNLENLARAISARTYPILLQGPTSAGKTSLIQYVAELLGRECLRVNNHEHTDLQEYVGTYTSNKQGHLVFQEGVLVTAMRKGHWIILDELNLAPTEVLEALNRVLDDNRELFIPETQELVKADPNFMLFGTQNPPGSYGGRKVLSRAFRNRFIELHFEDIPAGELVEILHLRCQLPRSYADKMVLVLKDLQERRSTSGIFAGKYGLITLRDLFRWAERYVKSEVKEKFYNWDQQLAEDGFMLLAGRLRESQDQEVVLEVIQKRFKCSITPRSLFGLDGGEGGVATRACLSALKAPLPGGFEHLVWTDELLKMAVLVHRCLQFDEPVLLVGNTGCGKTTLCQLLSSLFQRKFFSINCHMHTEAADFLGGLRPTRNHHTMETESGKASSLPFEWVDGVVLTAMKEGGCLLVDEISLADDAVLERLNSVLEPERKLVISERSRCEEEGEVFRITAREGFQFLATMNPGGDYGKKELSPALRNRFVEIWCPSSATRESYRKIIQHNLVSEYSQTGTLWSELILDILEWFKKLPNLLVSVRDVLMLVHFMNVTVSLLSPPQSFIHGTHLVFLDALGCGSASGTSGQHVKAAARQHVKDVLEKHLASFEDEEWEEIGEFCYQEDLCGIPPFMISRGSKVSTESSVYSLKAPGTKMNIFRVLRALQLGRPLLLEGSPGVGKTSLVSALANLSGRGVMRINLSEHTDVSDLFGSDLPVEGASGSCFEWRDGPFLRALKNGDWIILDEMNLASQSVLEGLNACLDHRGEIYVPELGMTFKVPVQSRIFACQNPLQQGGGRKGLPKSFLNRFTQVYIEPLTSHDMLVILSAVHPTVPQTLLDRMIQFTTKVSTLIRCSAMDLWEFNLRDMFRWCELMTKHQCEGTWDPGCYVELLFSSRLRDLKSRNKIWDLFSEVFSDLEKSSVAQLGTSFYVSSGEFQVGQTYLQRGLYLDDESRDATSTLMVLHSQLPTLEALLLCVKMNWMAIVVGPSCSGKSSIVKCLATLCGQKLLEFPMNSETDTIDLLGGFEQVNLKRTYCNLHSSVRDVLVYIQNLAKKNGHNDCKVNAFLDKLSKSGKELDDKIILQYSLKLKNMLNASLHGISRQNEDIPYDTERLLVELDMLIERVRSNVEHGQFEWVDSVFVKAVEKGYWLMISHANFCSSSVLDRLNALLEPGGVLRMDERGIVGDSVKVIVPHPNFRLFLTVDPTHGEISRAMRNRGVEIFLLPENMPDVKTSYPEDCLSLLCHAGDLDCHLACEVFTHCKKSPSLFQLKQFERIHRVLKDSDDDISSLSRTIFLSRFQRALDMDDSAPSVSLPTFHYQLPVRKCLDQPSLTSVRRDATPLFHLTSILKDQNDTGKLLGSSLFSSSIFIFLCCFASVDDLALRKSMLTEVIPLLSSSVIAQTEVKIWRDSLDAISLSQILHPESRTNTLLPLFLEKDNTSALFLIQVSGLESLLSHHIQLNMSSQRSSVITLSREASSGNRLVESLWHPSLFHLHSSLQTILSSIKLSLEDGEMLHSAFIGNCLDRVWAFLMVCMELTLDFSSIACAWSLLMSEGISEFVKCISTARSMELVDAVKNLQPLEDVMKRNEIYLALRDEMESQKSPHTRLVQQKADLKSMLETVVECANKGTSATHNSKECNAISIVPQSTVSKTCFSFFVPSPLTEGEEKRDALFSALPVMTLGNHIKKRERIRHLRQLLWLIGTASAYSSRNYLSIERQLLETSSELLLFAIRNAVTQICPETCVSITSTTAMSVKEIFSDARSFLTDYMSLQAWLDMESFMCSAISSLRSSDVKMDELDLLSLLSTAKVFVGVVQAHLMWPTPVDPIVTARTKYQCLKNLVEQSSNFMEAWNNYYLVMVGRSFKDIFAENRLPGVLSALVQKRRDLVEQLEKTQEDLPQARESTIEYQELSRLCTDLMQTLCSVSKVRSLISEVKDIKGDMSWAKVESWSKAVTASLRKMKIEFASFPDVVEPFSAGLAEVVDGLSTLVMVEKFRMTSKYTASVVERLARYPSVELPMNQAQWLMALPSKGLSTQTNSTELHESTLAKRFILQAVSLLTEHMEHLTALQPSQLPATHALFDICWTHWSRAEEAARQKEIEEQSLYRYKEKTHVIDGDGDSLEKDLKKLFPEYKEFLEVAESKEERMEEGFGMEDLNRTADHESSGASDTAIKFSPEEVQAVVNLHLLLNRGGHEEIDFWKHSTCRPAMESYDLAAYLARPIDSIPGFEFDRALLASHVNISAILLDSLNTTTSSRDYNIYQDPAPSENVEAVEVINDLVSKVKEFLEEWPDHPTLMQIVRTCERVLALDINSPLMKVLAGLEYILKKAQEWEAYASKKVSLSSQLETLTQLVLSWRKKELDQWKRFLQFSRKEVVQGACKWWFHIFGLCKDQATDIEDFTVSLQKFMETSTLGEYAIRLRIIAAFLTDFSRKGACSASHCLGNILMFYGQFKDVVEKTIQNLVSPIEKEFNETLSILRWNDGSYWAVKLSTEKNHRAIVKLINKHKEILYQPVQPVLTDSSMSAGPVEKKSGPSDIIVSGLAQLLQDLASHENPTTVELTVAQEAALGSLELSEGITASNAFVRMTGYVSEYSSSNMCLQWSNGVEEINKMILETVRELQSEDYLKGLDATKRKSAIKLRKSQTRRALGDLFDTLKREGLSYRKGGELKKDFHQSSFSLPYQQFPNLYSSDETLKALWDKMEFYYYRCIARMASFQSSFQSPSKDLNIDQIARSKGYVNQLMNVICSQRVLLFDSTQSLWELNCSHTFLEQLVKSNFCVVPKADYQEWLVRLGGCAERGLRVIEDFKRVVASLPESLDFSLTPYPQESFPLLTRCGNRSLAEDAVAQFEVHRCKLTDVYLNCAKIENENGKKSLPYIPLYEIDELAKGYITINSFTDTLLKILEVTGGHHTTIFEFLSLCYDECTQSQKNFFAWKECLLSNTEQCHNAAKNLDFEFEVQPSIRKVLLSVQKVMGRHSVELSVMNAGDASDTQGVKSLHSFTAQILEDLHLKTTLESFDDVLSKVPPLTKSQPTLRDSVVALEPILGQYLQLGKKAVTDLIVSHCTLSKLLSILLSTFTSLIAKGFCTPPEEVESEEASQGTEFVDIEAGGFDQGHGQSNVSDKVEQENIDAGGSQEKDEQDGSEEGEKEQDEKALDMEEDFDGDVEDVPGKEKEEGESDGEDSEGDEDHQMGDLGSDKTEELDRNMWAPEEKENSDSEKLDKEESGGGTAMDDETRMVAKDGDAGEADSKKQQELAKDLNEEEEEESDEAQNADYKPNDMTDLPEPEDMELGDLSLEDIPGGEDESEGEAEGSEAMSGSESEGEGDVKGEGQQEEVEEGEEEDKPLSPDVSDWAVDQTSYSGIDASAAEDKAANSNSSEKTNQDKGGADQEENMNEIPQNQGDSTIPYQEELKEDDSKDRRAAKRPKSTDASNRTLADEKDEMIIKRPKLMESQTTASHDPAARKMEDSSVYQHVGGESEGADGGASAWDSAPLDYLQSNPQQVPRPSEEAVEEEMEEAMDTMEPSKSKDLTESTVVASEAHQDKKDEDKMEEVLEGEDKESDDHQGVTGSKPAESFFSSGNFSRELALPNNESISREDLMSAINHLHSDDMQEGASDLWLKYESLTVGLSQLLFEELRLILLPTKAAQLKGDFRSGKRLNMRRIIPYIASDFQNNRIWLRRSKPSQREYQVLLAVDDSSSMHENQCIQMAYESLAVVSNALSQLEAGQIGVCRFGESVDILHPLDQPFTSSSGAAILQNLSFSQSKTNFVHMLVAAQSVFSKSRQQKVGGNRALVDQLLLILSDGRGVFADGSTPVEVAIRKLNEMGVFCVFVILDSLSKDSIVDIKVPTFATGKPLVMKTYLETFPFNYYIVLRDVNMMPHVLSQALRQWFEMIAEKSQ